LRMIEQIGTVPMKVALLGAFTLILGAFALLLWDLLRGRRHGWLRVMAVVVGAPACALAATVISTGVGWAVAATLEPDQQPPARTEQTTPENQQRTSSAEGRGPETTTERSASPTATATASPTVTASPTPSASATATASPSP
jgi:4-amino-4-deoxy-L-arabinose transferase-like glycosyltransferase